MAHEGDHLVLGRGFVDSLSADGDFGDNPTVYASESRAFRLTHSVYEAAGANFRPPCKNCSLGAGVHGTAVKRAIDRMLASPTWVYRVTPTKPGGPVVVFR